MEKEKDPLAPTPGVDCAEDVEQEERMKKEEKKNFACPQCPAEFKENFNLTKHVNSENKFMCDQCDLTFSQIDVIRRHEPIHKKKKKKIPETVEDPPCDERKQCF